jgi:uncharacterized protein (TIGR02246 family)
VSVQETHNDQAPSDLAWAAQAITQRLERAWNDADGAAFGEPFGIEADFVTIRGDLHTGRDVIATGHQQIFDTVYAGSTVAYRVEQARALDDRLVLAHIRATLNVPGGPMAGEHATIITAVLVKRDDGYEITAFHNTQIAS